MTCLTMTLGKLSASHFLRCRSERLSLVDIEDGEGRPASPNFYETGNDLVSHGGFERLFDTTSSVSSWDSNDQFFDALEEADSACLTNEEATVYLKNVLKVESTPTLETPFSIAAGDVRHQANYVTHEQPWTKVTRRHFVEHASVELGPPSVEGSYAGHHWKTPQLHPGLYYTRTKISNPRLVSLATGNGYSTPTTKKRGYKKRGKATYGHKHSDKQNINNESLNLDMPFYLI
jgi:hypothetical protein